MLREKEIINNFIYTPVMGHLESVNGKKTQLTWREDILLDTLIRNPGEIVSHFVLAKALFDGDMDFAKVPCPKVMVEQNISSLRKKLKIKKGDLTILTHHGIGYSFGDVKLSTSSSEEL